MLQIDTSWIKLTDDFEETVQIGREIVARNPQIYTPYINGRIWDVIEHYRSGDPQEQKDRLYYHSVYDYWIYGNSIDEEIFLGFEHKTGEEKRSYVTDRNRWDYIRFLNREEDWHLLRNKYEAYCLLKKYYKRDIMEITGEADWPVFEAFADKHPEFVVKPVGGSGAFGVSKVSLKDHAGKRELFSSLLVNMAEAENLSKLEKVKSLVLEEVLEQVEELAALHPASVNSIRLIAIRNGDEVSFFYPWIKCGASGSFIASAAVNGFDAGIDAATGVVATNGFKEDGSQAEFHPDTGVRFKGLQIPRWQELLDFTRELMKELPTFRYVGWDMVLTPDKGWCVMEGNHAGQLMGQVTFQKGLRWEFEEAMGWPKHA